MKSRTSFFDLTVFRKNLTRFAPVWGLYTLCLMMSLVLMCESGFEYWLPANLAECIEIMPAINLCYALIVAQLLFGDLFNTRMCNALHALPLRREGWFLTNVASGVVFSLGPTLVMTLAALPLAGMSRVVNAWQIPLLWLLGTNLQYLFFFGVAVLCVFCVGSRFAMALIYTIINFGANLIYWLVDTIYVPMLYGVRAQYDSFLPFFPVGQMADKPYIFMEQISEDNGVMYRLLRGEFTLTDSWSYLWICAGLGLAFMALALLLYRKRKLECAGDFIAVRPLEPVFLVLYSLVAAALFQLVFQMFFSGNNYFFMAVGLIVGFFTGKMLLERRVNVFRWKNWAALGVLAVAVGASLLINWLDPFGIETWMPKAENVERVILSMGNYYYTDAEMPLKDGEDIGQAIYIHEQALADRAESYMRVPLETEETGVGQSYKTPVDITITYEMKSGSTVRRYYTIWAEDTEGQIVREYFSSLRCVTGTDDLLGKLDDVDYFGVDGWELPEEYYPQEDIEDLLKAIEADCAAGTLVQGWCYHQGVSIFDPDVYYMSSVGLDIAMGGFGTSFQVYADSENTMAWLEEHGIIDYLGEQYYGDKYYG